MIHAIVIHAIVLHIALLHAQLTVPWIGGAAPTTAQPPPNYRPLILVPGRPVVLVPGQPLVLSR